MSRRGRPAVIPSRVLVAIGVLAGIVSASESAAQSPSCTISATSVAFGTYNVFSGTAVDSTGTITYRCNATAANITIALSRGTSSTYIPRTMSMGGELLAYNLYSNAGRTNIWGDGTAGTSVYVRANPPNDNNVNVTIFGRVSAGQDVSAGSFSDTISATINF